jgi:hypothetical protein
MYGESILINMYFPFCQIAIITILNGNLIYELIIKESIPYDTELMVRNKTF